jgi:hypothetical protein
MTKARDDKHGMTTAEKYALKNRKVDLTLVSAHANETEARVLEMGDAKYARRDYLKQENYDLEAMRALLRHVAAIMKGQQYDQESGQHHLAHVRANCGIILECFAFHNIEPGKNWPHEAATPKLESPPEETKPEGSQTPRDLGKRSAAQTRPSVDEPRKIPVYIPHSLRCDERETAADRPYRVPKSPF